MPLTAEAADWYRRATSSHGDWDVAALLDGKRDKGARISVVVPAKNEAATIASVVSGIREALVDATGLVDELIVMDSDSVDDTAAIARDHGATVHSTRTVAVDQGSVPGKGEALWKSLFVADGDLLVFIDADLTHWGTHFVTGLLGPLLASGPVELVKGFYDRLLHDGEQTVPGVGGRVTELVARPLLNLAVPSLAGVVQPLAGEWAIRRSTFEQLSVPTGYGVEIATLLDVFRRAGLASIAQVDLGRRAHVHQQDHDLGVMAAEVMQAAFSRLGHRAEGDALFQYRRDVPGQWHERPLPLVDRPPAVTVPSYRR